MGAVKLEDIPHYTYDDYVHWEGRWEVIYGVAYAMSPAPMKSHQSVSAKITRLLDEALDECEHCYASLPVDWKISEDIIVQPDNLVICEEPLGAYIVQAPPIIFEVLSKSTARKDTGVKFELYEREGVRWYIIVDPDEKIAKVYENIKGRFIKRLDATTDTCTFQAKGCQVPFDFSRLWKK